MRVPMMVLGMALVAGLGLFAIACDDDDDNDDASGGDADADGDADAGGDSDADSDADADSDSDADGDTTTDPFAGYNCAGMNRDTDPCGYDLCSMKTLWDGINTNYCGDSAYTVYCEAIVACYQDYMQCFENGCPPGTPANSFTSAHVEAISGCSTDLSTCTSAVSPPGR